MYGQYPQYIYGNSTYQAPYQRQMNVPQMQFQNQPQAQPQQTFDTPIQDIRYVTREEANAYIVFPNSKALLIDKNGCVAHLKSADSMGQSTSRYFKFEEVNADGSPLKPQEEMTETDCPNCRGEIVEAKECPFCGQTYISENEEFCDDCFEVWATEENALEMGNDDPTEIEINGFLASAFTKTEIVDILLTAFYRLPNDIRHELILNYCGEDKYLFKEWLEEKFRNVDLHKWKNHE